MFARKYASRRYRRGIVLVLILAMLGLLALIGVTFATYSGQAQVGARNFALGFTLPEANQVFDYGLSQLINDSDNPLSASRGHSLKRDVFGNNSAFAVRDPTTGNVVRIEANGFLGNLPAPCGANLYFTQSRVVNGQLQLRTNIAVGSYYPTLAGVDFTRWFVRVGPFVNPNGAAGITPFHAAQTFEVLQDDNTGQDAFSQDTDPCSGQSVNMHLLTINSKSVDGTTSIYNNNPPPNNGQQSFLTQPLNYDANNNLIPVPFVLDGRYKNAFDGPGMTKWAQYGNFMHNGTLLPFPPSNPSLPNLGDPNVMGMDEDYDACDLENWFLAIQSADGQVVVPSFHRPGILTAGDWTSTLATSTSKILRPRFIDHAPGNPFRDLVPDTNGRITYDVDNDGDGVTDAVWLDLGYAAQRDAAGKMFKPLFAFTVIGLNGRLPLNTVGNIQGRDVTGMPTWDHTSHLGTSVNEINPKFALQNANGAGYSQYDNSFPASVPPQPPGVPVSVTQLRNLLTGTRPQRDPYFPDPTTNSDLNFVLVGGQQFYMPNGLFDQGDPGYPNTPAVRSTPPVAGSWGEPYGVPVVLNQSNPILPAGTLPFNNPVRAGHSPTEPYYDVDGTDDNFDSLDFWGTTPETADHYDPIGSNDLASERIRRYVTPYDPVGVGRVMQWNTIPADVPGQVPVYGLGNDIYGRVGFFRYFRPPGFPLIVNNVAPFVAPATGPVDLTNNPLHGYDSNRSPFGSGQPINSGGMVANAPSFMAAAPYNVGTGLAVPTFDQTINSTGSTAAFNGYPFGSLTRDAANEMNLYNPTHVDSPFGYSDLEWLYRKEDTDGASLNSRLASLAPISFTNPGDGFARRRLFSIDSSEMTNFVWAHDNAGGGFPLNSSFAAFDGVNPRPDLILNPWLGNASAENYPGVITVAGVIPPVPPLNTIAPTPSVAHRDRKINLNFPFPVSNDPREPVRQKWISETYQLLKEILPPRAVDTPYELAQLSQFVVNIVDFRDPDGTMTIFPNPDLYERVLPAGTPPTLVLAANANPLTDIKLVQFGMEYNPIAISEIFAGAARANPGRGIGIGLQKKQTATALIIELVNSLTQGTNTAASDLKLANWDFVVMPDNPDGRPDPVTGQVPAVDIQGTFRIAANRPFYVSGGTYGPGTTDAGLTAAIPAMTSAGPPGGGPPHYYYALGSYMLDGAPQTDWSQIFDTPFTPDSALASQLVSYIAGAGPPANVGNYFWLYLRRPANPLATVDNNPNLANGQPNPAYNPSIVVDAFRFPYVGATFNGAPPAPDQDLYSMQRLQPYRGGHSVPGDRPTDAGAILPASYYGYTEQTTPTNNVFTTISGKDNNNNTGRVRLYMTMQQGNNPSDPSWDYFPFHDRDFMSVMELLLVPGVPPGLFSKKFAEKAPISANPANPAFSQEYTVAPPRPLNSGIGFYAGAGTQFSTRVPHPFPYLPDSFYYTALSPAVIPGPPPSLPPPQIGLSDGAGWFKMLEFFEVPSSSFGSIGPASAGQNFDWFRQDLKPGLINLNLIIDQEVFFGLIDDPRLNTNLALASSSLPRVVSQIDANGYPTFAYNMSNRGFWYDMGGNTLVQVAGMSAAFSDFLKLRHGGSGFLFAWQGGQTGSGSAQIPTNPTTPVAVERPFHALSYPDIDYTLMRPATLPPSALTTPPANNTAALYAGDPGLKNPFLNTIPPPNAPMIPPIPPRRLFEIPDSYGSVIPITTQPPSNASELGEPTINRQILHPDLANVNADLVNNTIVPPATAPPFYLGSTSNADERQNPYFRSEWLQKVANLSTVRTHQFAVWMTVGFFEVTQPGNPQLGVPDTLGQEIGLSSGRNTRYRAFFLVDRTRAVGFNLPWPGVASNDFRDCVVYRRRIE